jgi:DNA ligase-1
MTILAILNELAANSSTKTKQAILQREVGNDTLKAVFKAAYDITIKYGIKKIPEYSSFDTNNELSWGINCLSQLTNRNFTGGAASTYLADILSNLSSNDAEVIKRIIDRDLKCGTSDSIANKVWKGLVSDFPYMRCSLLKGAKLDKWDWKVGHFSQEKADAMYANGTHDVDGEVTLASRNGREFPLTYFAEIVEEIKTFPLGIMLNGELQVKRDGVILPREIGNGILNSVSKGGVFGKGEVPFYSVWDMIDVKYAVPKGHCNVPYVRRYANLLLELPDLKSIEMVETRIVYSIAEATAHFQEKIAQGKEGTILKNRDTEWKDGTSKTQIKFKVDCDVEMEIVGFNKGNNKNAATFGSIDCKSSDGKVICNIPGFKDDFRQWMSDNREMLIGRVITVRFNNLTPPTNKPTYSLFLPRFIELREDKFIADSLEQIKEQFESILKGK